LTDRETVDAFVEKFGCQLTVMPAASTGFTRPDSWMCLINGQQLPYPSEHLTLFVNISPFSAHTIVVITATLRQKERYHAP
jgi:hypothetical protein